jgi:hypothetical protein
MVAAVCTSVAGVGRAGNAIVAIGISGIFATNANGAYFRSIAPEAVVASRIHTQMITGVRAFVARVRRASNRVIAVRVGCVFASSRYVANFRSVAPKAVVASCIHTQVVAAVGAFVAGVRRASDTIVAVRNSRVFATGRNVTHFRPVAPEAVLTYRIYSYVVTGVRAFVAAISCAGN